MPERLKVVCVPCKALYKCSAFFLTNDFVIVIVQNLKYRNVVMFRLCNGCCIPMYFDVFYVFN